MKNHNRTFSTEPEFLDPVCLSRTHENDNRTIIKADNLIDVDNNDNNNDNKNTFNNQNKDTVVVAAKVISSSKRSPIFSMILAEDKTFQSTLVDNYIALDNKIREFICFINPRAWTRR